MSKEKFYLMLLALAERYETEPKEKDCGKNPWCFVLTVPNQRLSFCFRLDSDGMHILISDPDFEKGYRGRFDWATASLEACVQQACELFDYAIQHRDVFAKQEQARRAVIDEIGALSPA